MITMDRFSQHWQEIYQRLLESPEPKPSSRLQAVCYSAWPVLFNRVMDFFEQRAFHRLLKRAQVGLAGKVVLDVGCGTGRWFRLLTSQGGWVIGIDLFKELLKDNQYRFPQVRMAIMGVSELGFKNGVIDFLNAAIVLQHLPRFEKERALEEILRVLKRGGMAIVLEALAGKNYQEGKTASLLSLEEWAGWFSRHNLHVIDEEPLHAYPLASLYQRFTHSLEGLIKRLKTRGVLPKTDISPFNSPGKGKPVTKKRHLLYHAADQFFLKIIACLSFPLEFLWLALSGKGSHRIFLVKKAEDP